MAKYKGYATIRMYREFEFEADDDDLAWDHFEKLCQDGDVLDWVESGPDDVYPEDVYIMED